jgi:hypothetical protein
MVVHQGLYLRQHLEALTHTHAFWLPVLLL